jgi:hypothetical protein
MTPIFAYRRQDLLRQICDHLGYQGRHVWLIAEDRVAMLATGLRGPSRLRFRLLDITEEPVFKRLNQREGRVLAVKPNLCLAALPFVGDRRWNLLVFLHPDRLGDRMWSQSFEARLKPQEADILERKLEHYDDKTIKVVRAVCEYRGLLARDRVTKLGLLYLEAYHQGKFVVGIPRIAPGGRFKS